MDVLLPQDEPKSRSLVIPLLLILLGVSIGGGVYYLKLTYPSLFKDSAASLQSLIANKPIVNEKYATPSPTPNPTTATKPYVELPSGAQTYSFSHGDLVKGPRISKLTIDPLAIEAGQTQKISITATHGSEITKVVVTTITDNRTDPHELTLTQGKATDGTWEGNWTLTDTTKTRYGLELTLESKDEPYHNTMWFRN